MPGRPGPSRRRWRRSSDGVDGKAARSIEPGPPGHHVGHVHPALLDQPAGGVVDPVALTLDVGGLRLKDDHPKLAWRKSAALLHRVEQLLVVKVAVAEVPAVDHS